MAHTTFPVCEMPGCDQEIWLNPGERTVCEGCRLRGGPPPPPPPPPEPEPKWPEGNEDLVCANYPECERVISAPHKSGKYCMRCFRERQQS